jgi:hypothetical protein
MSFFSRSPPFVQCETDTEKVKKREILHGFANGVKKEGKESSKHPEKMAMIRTSTIWIGESSMILEIALQLIPDTALKSL